jgi:hypothetical protein
MLVSSILLSVFFNAGLRRGNAEESVDINQISGAIINCGMYVHSRLGPGLLEEPYKQCLAYELRKRGFNVLVEHPLPVLFDTIKVDIGYRLDLFHKAQLLTYLKLSKKNLGLILNFNTLHFKDGISRMVNELPCETLRPSAVKKQKTFAAVIPMMDKY